LGDLALFFSSYRAGGSGSQDIWYATRPDPSAQFGAATNVPGLNTASNEESPTLSDDGLDVIFAEGSPQQLFEATRSSTSVAFSTPAPLAFTKSTYDDYAHLSGDALRLWFVSNRDGVGRHMFETTRPDRGSPFASAVAHSELQAGAANDLGPTLSTDGLELYFTSNRTGGPGGYDIYTAHRAALDQAFTTPALVPELSSALDDAVTGMSTDRAVVYGSYDAVFAGGSKAQLVFATRTCN
jgi:hypothetical protein